MSLAMPQSWIRRTRGRSAYLRNLNWSLSLVCSAGSGFRSSLDALLKMSLMLMGCCESDIMILLRQQSPHHLRTHSMQLCLVMFLPVFLIGLIALRRHPISIASRSLPNISDVSRMEANGSQETMRQYGRTLLVRISSCLVEETFALSDRMWHLVMHICVDAWLQPMFMAAIFLISIRERHTWLIVRRLSLWLCDSWISTRMRLSFRLSRGADREVSADAPNK